MSCAASPAVLQTWGLTRITPSLRTMQERVGRQLPQPTPYGMVYVAWVEGRKGAWRLFS